MNNGKVFIGIFTFIMFYSFFILLIFGNNYFTQNPFPDINSYFNINNVINTASVITGGQWVFNLMGATLNFEAIHQVIIWFIIPFIFIYNIFAFIFSIIYWFINMINYPFTFIPAPFSTFGQIFLFGLITIEILFSIRIFNSGLGGS